MGLFLREDIGRPDDPIQTYRYYDDDDLASVWSVVLFILALPFLVVFFMIKSFCAYFAAHLLLCATVYFVFAVITGIILYIRRRYLVIGIVSTLINLLPLFNLLVFYGVPIISSEANFDNSFEFILTVFFCVSVEVFILALARVINHGIKHMIISAIFLLVASLLLRGLTSGRDECTLYALQQLYF